MTFFPFVLIFISLFELSLLYNTRTSLLFHPIFNIKQSIPITFSTFPTITSSLKQEDLNDHKKNSSLYIITKTKNHDESSPLYELNKNFLWVGSTIQSKIIQIQIEKGKLYSYVVLGNSTIIGGFEKDEKIVIEENYYVNCVMMRNWQIDETKIYCNVTVSGDNMSELEEIGGLLTDGGKIYGKYSGVYVPYIDENVDNEKGVMYVFGKRKNMEMIDVYKCIIGKDDDEEMMMNPMEWGCEEIYENYKGFGMNMNNKSIVWGLEVIKDKEFVYVFGVDYNENGKEYVLRMKIENFEDDKKWIVNGNIEYYSNNGEWKTDDNGISEIVNGNSKDSNCIFNEKLDRWLMIKKNKSEVVLLYSDDVYGPYENDMVLIRLNETIEKCCSYFNIFPVVDGLEFNEFMFSYLIDEVPQFVKVSFYFIFDVKLTFIIGISVFLLAVCYLLIAVIFTIYNFVRNFRKLKNDISIYFKNRKKSKKSEIIEITNIGSSNDDNKEMMINNDDNKEMEIEKEADDFKEKENKNEEIGEKSILKEKELLEADNDIDTVGKKSDKVTKCSKGKFHDILMTILYTSVESLDGMVWMLIPLSFRSLKENCSGENVHFLYVMISCGQVTSLIFSFSVISTFIDKFKSRFFNIHTVMAFALSLVGLAFLTIPFVHNVYILCMMFFCFGVSLSLYFQINKILLNWIWRKKFKIPIYVNAIAYCFGGEVVSVFSSIVFKTFHNNNVQLFFNFYLVGFSFLIVGILFAISKLPKNPYEKTEEKKKVTKEGDEMLIVKKQKNLSGYYSNILFICSLLSLTATAAMKEGFKSVFAAYTTLIPDKTDPLEKMFTESQVSVFFSVYTAIIFVRKCTSVFEVIVLSKIHNYIILSDFIGILVTLLFMVIFNNSRLAFWIFGSCHGYFCSTIKAALITLPFSGRKDVKFGPIQTTLISICYLLSTPLQTPILSFSDSSFPLIMIIILLGLSFIGFMILFLFYIVNKLLTLFKRIKKGTSKSESNNEDIKSDVEFKGKSISDKFQ